MVVKNNKPHFHVTAGLLWRNGMVLITKRPEGSNQIGIGFGIGIGIENVRDPDSDSDPDPEKKT